MSASAFSFPRMQPLFRSEPSAWPRLSMAEAVIRGIPVELVRTGTRGMLLAGAAGRDRDSTASPRLRAGDAGRCAGPLRRRISRGRAHRLALGPAEELDWIKRQERLTFARCGIIDPLSLDDYVAHGGLVGLRDALEPGAQAIVDEVKLSGLRGRGGAGFPTRHQVAARSPNAPGGPEIHRLQRRRGRQRHLRRPHADGGRSLLPDRGHDRSPGLAVGATKGFIYLRSEYPHAFAHAAARRSRSPQGGAARRDRRRLRQALRPRGAARRRAPISAARKPRCWKAWKASAARSAPSRRCRRSKGLFGKPTVVNNVHLARRRAVDPGRRGRQAYADFGMGRSRGTLPIQLAGNMKHGGLVETRLRHDACATLVEDFGGGTASGRPVRAVQVGGPLGAYFPTALFDTPLDYEAFAAVKGMLGHGGIVVFDDTRRHGAGRRASRWSSARSRAAASARPAASAPRAASR